MSDDYRWTWGEPTDIAPYIAEIGTTARQLAQVTCVRVECSDGTSRDVIIEVAADERVSVKGTTAGFVVLVSRTEPGKRYWWKPWRRRVDTVSRQYPIYTTTENP